MPISKSAKKAIRQAAKRTVHNRTIKAKIKIGIKEILSLAIKKDQKAAVLSSNIISLIDKAAKNHIIHKNRAARLKSRISEALDRAKIAPSKREIVKPKPAKKSIKKKPVKKTAKIKKSPIAVKSKSIKKAIKSPKTPK